MGMSFDSMMRNQERMFEAMTRKPDNRGRRYTGNPEFDEKVSGPWQDDQPKLFDFRGIYAEEEISRDQRKVEEINNSPDYKIEQTPDAAFLEYGMMEGVHNNEWFGEGVNITPTADFDDYVNHIDFVASIPGVDERRYYLGVDTTISDDVAVRAKKLEQTLNKLERNALTRVKYFQDDENPEKRGTIFVPRVVIGASGDRLRRIKEGLFKKRSYALDEDIKQELVEEILDQLVNNTKLLLEEHFSETAKSLRDSKEVLDYIIKHRDKIAKNQRLWENIEKHVGLIRYFESIGEIK